MEKDELYLAYINGNMDRRILGCPVYVSAATIVQSIAMIRIIYKSASGIEDVLKVAGHKMNEHALEVMREEIDRHYRDLMLFTAGIEN